ncbi:MAG: MFS transporter [Rhizobiaceae bacterium]|nr:MFS transporter [Rhizobiaceae bacterium]
MDLKTASIPAAPDVARQSPRMLVATVSVILSMILVAIGNGLMFAYIPVRLGMEGFAPAWAGSILTGLAAGGIAGCLLTGALVRRTGHARAYMVLSALIVISNVGIAAGPHPVLWIAARALYGFGMCALFIVSQSWLNDVVGNAIRGRVMAVFYVSYIVAMGLGSLMLALLDAGSAQAPLIGIVFAALSMLPVGMTRLAQPPAPQSASVALRRSWQISPVGVAGMFAIGGLSMMVAGFAPIHATAKGFTQQEVAALMFAMPLGTLLLQIPMGWVSDRTDRRYVLIAASILVALIGAAAARFDGASLGVVLVIYLVWSGASESIYSLATAHANDRASKEDLVALSSTLLFAWSIGGIIAPALGTALTARFGTQSFIYVAISIALAYALFVVWRVSTTRAVPAEETGNFAPMTAQAPVAVDLAFPTDPDAR